MIRWISWRLYSPKGSRPTIMVKRSRPSASLFKELGQVLDGSMWETIYKGTTYKAGTVKGLRRKVKRKWMWDLYKEERKRRIQSIVDRKKTERLEIHI